MIVADYNGLSIQDKIDLFRQLLNNMPPAIRTAEITRAWRIDNKEPIYLIETPDGNTFRTGTAKQIKTVIELITGKEPTLSNIYKVLRGESKTIYGLTITKHKESFNDGTID